MKYLLLILVLFTVACTAEFQGTGSDVNEPLAGAAGSAGEAAAGSPGAGAGGSSSAGAAGSATAGGGQGGSSAGAAGMPSAGTGGAPVTCDQPELVLPTEFSLQSWSMERDAQCATMLEPLTCSLTWSIVGWIDDSTYEAQIATMTCNYPKFSQGSCDAGGTCEPTVFLASPGTHVRVVVVDGEIAQALVQGGSDWGAYDIIGVMDNDCGPTVPNGWTGDLQAETNRTFRGVLAGSTVECS